MVSVPSSPVKVTNVVAWSGSVANQGDTNFHDDDPPPACCHDPAWATPLTVSAVGLSPVQIQTVVPGAASLQSSLTGQPLPAQPSVAPSAMPVPGPKHGKGQHRSHGQPAQGSRSPWTSADW